MRRRVRECGLVLATILGMVHSEPRARASAYNGSPRLIVILVFDQFRGDYLERYRADFHAKNGWNLFLQQGAHYTNCYYDYDNLVTAPGHATIGTGSYTVGHSVPVNEWWEPGPDGKPRLVSSVQDDRYRLVGLPSESANVPGVSPKNEVASTLGDELVLATGGKSKVFGISLKDRAAVLTSGHASRGAFWVDHDTGTWVSSTYWMEQLPAWAAAFNASGRAAEARQQAHIPSGSFYDKVGPTSAAVSYQLDFAKALIAGEHLGQNPAGVTDLLTLSISSTDLLGHADGPDSPEQRALIDAADGQLDIFFTWLDHAVGLRNVLVAFTADHGVAPVSAAARVMGMPSRAVSSKSMTDFVESALQAKFKLKGRTRYVLGAEFPWLQIDPAPFEAEGISEATAESATAEALRAWVRTQNGPQANLPGLRKSEPLQLSFVYTATQMRTGDVPETAVGRRELNSYSDRIGWAVHLNFGPYQYAGPDTGATHYSGQAYDRHVPLDIFGGPFVPGTYYGGAAPVDIAATFASLLGINQPSASVGRVLTEALQPSASHPSERGTGEARAGHPAKTR